MHLFGVLLEYIEGATNLVSAVQLALNTDRKTALERFTYLHIFSP